MRIHGDTGNTGGYREYKKYKRYHEIQRDKELEGQWYWWKLYTGNENQPY